ncbi:hypothetical protein WI99_25145 [Burkholderia cepacia]|uniref:hypothetical protein n=1 Tax=Burkholderia cepacia TaxID=292 RepID=UPI00076D9A49|nr:hypothetical protein [Burkholderia cepacia]KVE81059.1 hypothetical protein WI99_25145 [Burkholderia cepacia]
MKKQTKKVKPHPFTVPSDGRTYQIVAVDSYACGSSIQRVQIIYKGHSYPAIQIIDYVNADGLIAVEDRHEKIHLQYMKENPVVTKIDRTKEYLEYSGLSYEELHVLTIKEGLAVLEKMFAMEDGD